MDFKPYLKRIELKRDEVPSFEYYPFSIPAVRELHAMDFHRDVTFLMGENGAGKSTLIEAIALAMGFGPEGGTKNVRFSTAETTSPLYNHLKIVKSYAMPKDFYFMRAESFYNVASFMDGTGYFDGYGGKSLHAQSHGESFMAVLLNKLRGKGFYIMDEPEAALSPSRQLAALAAIHKLVQQDSQFIIATHSPILLAYPNAKIIRLDGDGFEEIAYEETEYYSITRTFLNNPERMLAEIMREEESD